VPAESPTEDSNCTRNLSYCLFILDKAASWITGTPPGLPAHMVSIRNNSNNSNTAETIEQDAGNFITRAKFACIEEKIYTYLYTEHSRLNTEEEFHQIVRGLYQDLQTWALECDINLDPGEKSITSELCSFYAARILIKWLLHTSSPGIDASMMEDMRKYMVSIVRLWDTNTKAGQRAFVARYVVSYVTTSLSDLTCINRLLASYPCIAPLGFAVGIIRGQSEKNDLHLLQRFQNLLRAIAESSEETGHIIRLYRFVSLMVDYTTTFRQSRGSQDSMLCTEQHAEYAPNAGHIANIDQWMQVNYADGTHPTCQAWADPLSVFVWSEG
jgi:hypothetical protein